MNIKEKKIFKIIKKILYISIIVLIIISGIISVALYTLPGLISSKWFKSKIEHKISTLICTDLSIERINFNWSDGLFMKNIIIKDNSNISNNNLLNIEKIYFDFFIGKLFSKQLAFDLFVENTDINLLKTKDGSSNLDNLIYCFSKESQHKKRSANKHHRQSPEKKDNDDIKSKNESAVSEKNFQIPIDITSNIQLNNINICYNDLINNKKFSLNKTKFNISLKSLISEPINLKIESNAEITNNKKKFGFPVSVNFYLNNLFNSKNNLDLNNIYIDLFIDAFLIDSNYKGALSKKFSGKTNFYLNKLHQIIEILLPEQFSNSLLNGTISFGMDTLNNSIEDQISLSSYLSANNILFSGGVLKEKSIGPIDFNISDQINFNIKNNDIKIINGKCTFLKNNKFNWLVNISGINSDDVEIQLNFNNLYIDIINSLDIVRSFIPDEFKYILSNNAWKITMSNLMLMIYLNSKDSYCDIKDISVDIPNCKINEKNYAININDFNYSIKEIKTHLKNFFPDQFKFNSLLNIESVDFKEKNNNINLKRISIPDLTINCNELQKNKNSASGINLGFNISELLNIEEISILDLVKIKNIEQKLLGDLSIKENEKIYIDISDFSISTKHLILTIYKKIIDTFFSVKVNSEKIVLDTKNPMNTDISSFKTNIETDKFLNIDFDCEVLNKKLKSSSNIFIDFNLLSTKIITKLINNLTLNGESKLSINTEFTFPNDIKQKDLKKYYTIDNIFNHIVDLKIKENINNISARLKLIDNKFLNIESINTQKPFTYKYDSKEKTGKFSGILNIGKIQAIDKKFLDKPLNLIFSLKGSHQKLNSIELEQNVNINPYNINQTLNLSLFGFNDLVNNKYYNPSGYILKCIEGEVYADLVISNTKFLKSYIDDIKISGDINTGIYLKNIINDKLITNFWSKVSDMDMSYQNSAGINDLKMDINLERQFKVYDDRKFNDKEFYKDSLSYKVIRSNTNDNEYMTLNKNKTYYDNVHKKLKNQPAIYFEKLYYNKSSAPINLNDSIININFIDGLPCIDYFQFDVLNGTVNGYIKLEKHDHDFLFNMESAFSNLNLYLNEQNSNINKDSEINGNILIKIPFLLDVDSILSKMHISLYFTKIGKNALERFLYSIDPYESNETITSQRKLLNIGTPIWIHLLIKNGSLSLKGEVYVKGIVIKIPELKRLNISAISGFEKYENQLKNLSKLTKILETISSNTIKIEDNGKLNFKNIQY